MTLTCPPKVTADSGIDALTHAIEAYTAIDNADFPLPAGERTGLSGKASLGDLVPEQAITLVGKFLAGRSATAAIWRPAKAWRWRRCWPAWPSPTSASPSCMPWNIPSAAPSIAPCRRQRPAPPLRQRFNLPAKTKVFAHVAHLLGENIIGLGEQAAAEKAVSAVKTTLRHRHPRPPARHRHQAGTTARPGREDLRHQADSARQPARR